MELQLPVAVEATAGDVAEIERGAAVALSAEIADRMRNDTHAEVELATSRAVQGGTDAVLSEADEERLRALGYIK
jgi:hypothetical protein